MGVTNIPDEVIRARLFTQGIVGRRTEFRIHVVRGRAILSQVKLRRNVEENTADDSQSIVRNVAGGWVYGVNDAKDRQGAAPAMSAAAEAIQVAGLDCGAVDIVCQHATGRAFVLEINTAPGLDDGGSALEAYTQAFTKIYEEGYLMAVRVFVYGTLLTALYNHCLLDGAEFIGNAASCERGLMYGACGFPILSCASRADLIAGEMWQLPGGEAGKEMLNNLDRLEGYPGWYDRSPKNFRINGESITALVYHQDSLKTLDIVQDGDWKAHPALQRRADRARNDRRLGTRSLPRHSEPVRTDQELRAQKMLLLRIIGLMASQRQLQDSISASVEPATEDSNYSGYCDESAGIRFMWERLKAVEDELRLLEKQLGEFSYPYLTYPGNVNPVPSLVLKSQLEG
ncbi:hypothetical protein [Pseudomonas phage vB_PaS-HSN4]|nr:hypothetical protein [Pseudomonas phage vB_PaS-HSN4]